MVFLNPANGYIFTLAPETPIPSILVANKITHSLRAAPEGNVKIRAFFYYLARVKLTENRTHAAEICKQCLTISFNITAVVT